MFVVKDGFLLYYEDTKAPTSWFDSRPKVGKALVFLPIIVVSLLCPQGVIPMGSSRVSKVSIGSHPHCIRVECSELDRGRELIVACSSERDRNRWYEALELATVVYVFRS